MNRSRLLRIRAVALALLVLVLSLAPVGCRLVDSPRSYPEHRMSLVWEADIPGIWCELRPIDSGAAEVTPRGERGNLPTVFFDASGRQVPGFDRSEVPKRNSDLSFYDLALPLNGWLVLDQNSTIDLKVEDHGDGTSTSGERVFLDTVVKLVSRDGGVVAWEAPGLAGARPFHIDKTVIGFVGKDPALLVDAPSGLSTYEFGAEMATRYQNAPTRVQLLDVITGRVVAESELPPADVIAPIAVVRDARLGDGDLVLSEVRPERFWPPSGFVLTRATDGDVVRSVDFRTALPGVTVGSLTYGPAGLIISGYGSVTVMDLEGRARWTATVRGAGEIGSPPPPGSREVSVPQPPGIWWSSTAGQIMAVCGEAAPYSRPGEAGGRGLRSVSVFDADGKELLYQRDLQELSPAVDGSARLAGTAAGPKVGEDFLYVVDIGKDAVTVSRATLPTLSVLALSPSGEYVLTFCVTDERSTLPSPSGDRIKLRMYRLEGR